MSESVLSHPFFGYSIIVKYFRTHEFLLGSLIYCLFLASHRRGQRRNRRSSNRRVWIARKSTWSSRWRADRQGRRKRWCKQSRRWACQRRCPESSWGGSWYCRWDWAASRSSGSSTDRTETCCFRRPGWRNSRGRNRAWRQNRNRVFIGRNRRWSVWIASEGFKWKLWRKSSDWRSPQKSVSVDTFWSRGQSSCRARRRWRSSDWWE